MARKWLGSGAERSSGSCGTALYRPPALEGRGAERRATCRAGGPVIVVLWTTTFFRTFFRSHPSDELRLWFGCTSGAGLPLIGFFLCCLCACCVVGGADVLYGEHVFLHTCVRRGCHWVEPFCLVCFISKHFFWVMSGFLPCSSGCQ